MRRSLRTLRLISADFLTAKHAKILRKEPQRFEFIKLLLFPYPELTLNYISLILAVYKIKTLANEFREIHLQEFFQNSVFNQSLELSVNGLANESLAVSDE